MSVLKGIWVRNWPSNATFSHPLTDNHASCTPQLFSSKIWFASQRYTAKHKPTQKRTHTSCAHVQILVKKVCVFLGDYDNWQLHSKRPALGKTGNPGKWTELPGPELFTGIQVRPYAPDKNESTLIFTRRAYCCCKTCRFHHVFTKFSTIRALTETSKRWKHGKTNSTSTNSHLTDIWSAQICHHWQLWRSNNRRLHPPAAAHNKRHAGPPTFMASDFSSNAREKQDKVLAADQCCTKRTDKRRFA